MALLFPPGTWQWKASRNDMEQEKSDNVELVSFYLLRVHISQRPTSPNPSKFPPYFFDFAASLRSAAPKFTKSSTTTFLFNLRPRPTLPNFPHISSILGQNSPNHQPLLFSSTSDLAQPFQISPIFLRFCAKIHQIINH
jgi:hypothetical protein